MDEFDLQICDLLSVVAALVNQASATSVKTVPSHVQVPYKLLLAAQTELRKWSGCEYSTNEVRSAVDRPIHLELY